MKQRLAWPSELLKIFPCLALGEDWMQGPEIVTELGLHNGKGNGGALMNSMTGDLSDMVGDVLSASSNGVAPSIHRFCGGG